MGDLSGYTLTLTAQEVKPANFIAGVDLTNAEEVFAGMAGATVTIVP